MVTLVTAEGWSNNMMLYESIDDNIQLRVGISREPSKLELKIYISKFLTEGRLINHQVQVGKVLLDKKISITYFHRV